MAAKRRGRRRSRRTTPTGQGILVIVLLLVAGGVGVGGDERGPARRPATGSRDPPERVLDSVSMATSEDV